MFFSHKRFGGIFNMTKWERFDDRKDYWVPQHLHWDVEYGKVGSSDWQHLIPLSIKII